MKTAFKASLLISYLIFAGGCTSHSPVKDQKHTVHEVPRQSVPENQGEAVITPVPPSVTEEVRASPSIPVTVVGKSVPVPVNRPSVVKKYDYNWEAVMKQITDEMTTSGEFGHEDTLLVGRFRNNTNGEVDLKKGKNYFLSALNESGMFRVISSRVSLTARQQLGLHDRDMISTPGKVLAVARKCGAKFALYTSLKGKITAPLLTVSIIGTADGIIYFGTQHSLKSTLKTVKSVNKSKN